MTKPENLQDMATLSVADVAIHFPFALPVLNQYHLDYCCNGKTLFTEACKKVNADAEKVWFEILHSNPKHIADTNSHFESWPADLLIDFIEQQHHNYVREAIPQIHDLLDKVCSVHGADQPELLEVRHHFVTLADELLSHLRKEEDILFPAIRRVTAQPALRAEGSPVLANLQAPIMIMEHEHDRAGDIVKLIRSLTKNYSLPPYACPTFCLTYKMLEEFETDLMQHVHLENNVLFAKVEAVDKG